MTYRTVTSAGDSLGSSDTEIILSGGAFYTFTINAVSTYVDGFTADLINTDTGRGKKLILPDSTTRMLWPHQKLTILKRNGVLIYVPFSLRWSAKGIVFYVDPINGDDGNDGLASGSGAMKTIQPTATFCQFGIDTLGTTAMIQLADGTYSENVVVYGDPTGADQIAIQGNLTHPENVCWHPSGGFALSVQDKGIVTVQGIDFALTGGSGVLLGARQFSVIDFFRCRFGAASNHLDAAVHAVINAIDQNYEVYSSPVGCHAHANLSAVIELGGIPCRIPNALTFYSWAQAVNGGYVASGGQTYSGAGLSGCSGLKASWAANGIVDSYACFPGSGTSP